MALNIHFFASTIQHFKTFMEGGKGYDSLLIANGLGGDTPVDSYLNHCRQRGVDGIVIFCTDVENEGIQELLKSQLPSVIFDNPKMGGTNSVYSDHYLGSKKAVEYLIKLGHKEIAHIYADVSHYPGKRRKQAYMDVLNENNIVIRENLLQDGGCFEFDKSKEAMDSLLKLDNRPTAIFAASDIMALGAIKSCHQKGLNVPDDISVIGYDNLKMLEWISPRISSVAQDMRKIGRECARILLDKIEKPNYKRVDSVMIPTTLIIGDTCKQLN